MHGTVFGAEPAASRPLVKAIRVRSKLDAHEAYIMALVDAEKDITLTEIAARLVTERCTRASRALVWYVFDKRGVTFKKRRRTLPSSTGRTSRGSAGPGSMVSSTSTRPARRLAGHPSVRHLSR